jgi:hypothetical protein
MFDQEISWQLSYHLKQFYLDVRAAGYERAQNVICAEYSLNNIALSHDPYEDLAKALLQYQTASTPSYQELKHVEMLCTKYGQLIYLELPRFAKLLVEYGVLPQPHSPFAWLLRPDLAGIELTNEGDLIPCFQLKSNGH